MVRFVREKRFRYTPNCQPWIIHHQDAEPAQRQSPSWRSPTWNSIRGQKSIL
jgi:hypothetical protein